MLFSDLIIPVLTYVNIVPHRISGKLQSCPKTAHVPTWHSTHHMEMVEREALQIVTCEALHTMSGYKPLLFSLTAHCILTYRNSMFSLRFFCEVPTTAHRIWHVKSIADMASSYLQSNSFHLALRKLHCLMFNMINVTCWTLPEGLQDWGHNNSLKIEPSPVSLSCMGVYLKISVEHIESKVSANPLFLIFS